MKTRSFIFYKCLFFVFLHQGYAQKQQKIAFVDMEYILERLPVYINSTKKIEQKISIWNRELDREKQEIKDLEDSLKYDTNEKNIAEKRKIIARKKQNIKQKEQLYFGTKGKVFSIRLEFIKPIQDEIFNAIQMIAKKKKYDFVFDKSTGFTVLYTNPRYDISDLVLTYIKVNHKKIEK